MFSIHGGHEKGTPLRALDDDDWVPRPSFAYAETRLRDARAGCMHKYEWNIAHGCTEAVFFFEIHFRALGYAEGCHAGGLAIFERKHHI